MRIEKALTELDLNFFRLIDKDIDSKSKYITFLTSKVSLENPYYKVSTRHIYNLLRESFEKFYEESDFKCLTCEDSCCFFNKDEYYYKPIGIYREDYDLLVESNSDLSGYVNLRSWDNTNHLNEYIQRLGLKGEIKKIEKTSKKAFSDVMHASLEILGYLFNLELIKAENSKYKCYYYNEINRTCEIHHYKPLVCLTYPFRFINDLNFIGTVFADDCNHLKTKFKELTFEKYRTKIFRIKSYWEYILVSNLYMVKKGLNYIHNNRVMRDDDKMKRQLELEINKIIDRE